MKDTPQAKHVRQVSRPKIIAQFEGVEIVRGRLRPKIVAEGDERWSDFLIDRCENTTRNPMGLDEVKKVRKRRIWDWIYERHLQNLTLMRLPLETEQDFKKFDREFHDLVDFWNRSDLHPNVFTVSVERERGTQGGIKFIGKNERSKVKQPPFKFSVKIELLLNKMEF